MNPAEITLPVYASASATPATMTDLIDLDSFFQDDFFPDEVDYGSQIYSSIADPRDNLSVSTVSSIALPMGFTPPTPQTPPTPMDMVPRGVASEILTIPPSVPTTEIPLPVKKKGRDNRAHNSAAGAARADAEGDSDDTDSDDNENNEDRLYSKRQAFDDQPLSGASEQPPEGRRERNKEHAKRSRWRKKVLLDTLQGQLATLREENNRLRRVIVDRMPHMATTILSQCTSTESSLMDDYDGGGSNGGSLRLNESVVLESARPATAKRTHAEDEEETPKGLMESDYRFIHSLVSSQQTFVLSDPLLPDNPIIYCSDGFCKLTGYKRNAVLGRNCRFLQGPGTDQHAVDIIRKGLQSGRDVSVCLLNYKADGTPFWNQFFVGALRDDSGQIVNHVGIQCEVTSIPVKEIKDRVKKIILPGT